MGARLCLKKRWQKRKRIEGRMDMLNSHSRFYHKKTRNVLVCFLFALHLEGEIFLFGPGVPLYLLIEQ